MLQGLPGMKVNLELNHNLKCFRSPRFEVVLRLRTEVARGQRTEAGGGLEGVRTQGGGVVLALRAEPARGLRGPGQDWLLQIQHANH